MRTPVTQQPCIYCGRVPRVRKSHIVTDYLYEHVKEDGKILVYDETLRISEAPRQSGHHEPLLCATCETLFNRRWEQPCQQFFRSLPESAPFPGSITLCIPHQLRGLVLSILWRAAHSHNPSWSDFRSGCDVPRLRHAMETGSDPDVATYMYVLVSENGKLMKGLVTSPYRLVAGSLDALCIACYGVQFVVVFRALGKGEPAVGMFNRGGLQSFVVHDRAWSTAGLSLEGSGSPGE